MSCLFVPRLGDIYGRKPIYLVSIFFQIPLYGLCAYTSSIYVIYGAATLLGPTVIGRMSCGFFLLMESARLQKESQQESSLAKAKV